MSGHTQLPATPLDLPLLPLRDVVVFPHMVIPLFVGRPKSIKALEAAMETDRRIMLVAQKAAAKDDPLVSDMFDVGCVSTILQMLKLPDGTVKVLVEGLQRASVNKIEDGELHFSANVTPIEADVEPVVKSRGKASEIEALRRAVMLQFDQTSNSIKKSPPRYSPPSPVLMMQAAWPIRSLHTCRLSSKTSSLFLPCQSSNRGWRICLNKLNAKSIFLMSIKKFAAASSDKWKKTNAISI
jgi:Lon protease-like protein